MWAQLCLQRNRFRLISKWGVGKVSGWNPEELSIAIAVIQFQCLFSFSGFSMSWVENPQSAYVYFTFCLGKGFLGSNSEFIWPGIDSETVEKSWKMYKTFNGGFWHGGCMLCLLWLCLVFISQDLIHCKLMMSYLFTKWKDLQSHYKLIVEMFGTTGLFSHILFRVFLEFFVMNFFWRGNCLFLFLKF